MTPTTNLTRLPLVFPTAVIAELGLTDLPAERQAKLTQLIQQRLVGCLENILWQALSEPKILAQLAPALAAEKNLTLEKLITHLAASTPDMLERIILATEKLFQDLTK